MATIQSITAAALRKINLIGSNEVPSAAEVELSMARLNALLDSRSNELTNIYRRVPLVFLLENNQYSYDLGPTGDWVTERPMRLELSRLLLNPVIVTAPTAAFTFSVTDNVATFVDASLFNPTAWLWDFGDGTTSTLQDPVHEYSTVGYQLVTLTVTNEAGTDTQQTYIYANAAPPPPVVGLWQFNSTAATMQYASAYGSFIDVGGEFDSSYLPTGGTLPTSTIASIDQTTYTPGTFRGTVAWDDDGSSRAVEFKLLAPVTNYVQCGVFIQAYGPPFDANSAFGGPLSSYLVSNSYSAAIFGYGGQQATLPGLNAGDVVGVVNTDYGMTFYVNGVSVGTAGNSNNVGLTPMCGVSNSFN
jgi:PKD repeat protein